MSEHGLYVSYAPRMIDSIVKGETAVVLGSRLKGGGSAIAQGMPWCEYMSNRFRTGGEHSCFGLGVSEYHTGSRAFSHEVLEGLNSRMPSDGFAFDQEIISPVVAGGLPPRRVRRAGALRP